MILLDTSVWVDHLRRAEPRVVEILESGRAVIHPFVVGELACGLLNPRDDVLALLRSLKHLDEATDDEVLDFIESHRLMGRGIGFVDVHLLAASVLNGATLWTKDRRLHEIAAEMRIVAPPN
jgi:predicted nucleic acid-binding protein